MDGETNYPEAPVMARMSGSTDETKRPADPVAHGAAFTGIDGLLRKVGCGTDGLNPPTAEDEAWPPIPAKYKQAQAQDRYFRTPDIVIGDSGSGYLTSDDARNESTFEQLLCQVMDRNGMLVRRNGAVQAVRTVSAVAIGATVVGGLYLNGRIKQVPPGSFGLFYTLDKEVRFVKSGWSMEHNPFHHNFRIFQQQTEYINYNNHLHIVRVKPGFFAVCRFNGNSRLLNPGADNRVGVHIIVDPTFEYLRAARRDAPYINLPPINIINVAPGHVRPVTVDRRPHVLMPGTHVLECSTIDVHDQEFNLTESFSWSGMIHHYLVRPGELGGIRVNEHTAFIDSPTECWFYSALVKHMEPRSLEEEKVEFGPLTRLIVDDYRRGLIRDSDGSLVVLPPGVHVIARPNIHLTTTSGEWHHCREEMQAITADPLDVKLRMTMTYHVVDPIAFFKAGAPDEAHQMVREMAKSIMSEIIRHMRFEETLKRFAKHDDGREDHKNADAVDADVKHSGDEVAGEEPIEATPAELIRNQWKSISSTFTGNFKRILARDFGLEMDDSVWGFQDFDLKDQKFQDQLTKAVKARSEARAERVRLDLTKETAQVKKETARIEAERKKFEATLEAQTTREIDLMRVKTEQEVLDAKVKAESQRKEMERKIEEEDVKSRSDAHYYKISREADARAYDIQKKAEAEQQLLLKNPKHFELESLRIQAQMFQEMKPQIIIGDAGNASMQKAMANFVSKMTGSLMDEHLPELKQQL